MKLGFIGAGNMGSAIISGILNKGALPADCIYVSRKHPEKGAELARKGVHIMKDNLSLVQAVDCVLLAVKPVYAADVIREVYDALDNKFVISIIAGWTGRQGLLVLCILFWRKRAPCARHAQYAARGRRGYEPDFQPVHLYG